MKKYMVVTSLEGSTNAKFFDRLIDAEQYRMDAECGVGAYAQVYELRKDKYGNSSYSFMYS